MRGGGDSRKWVGGEVRRRGDEEGRRGVEEEEVKRKRGEEE